jgi:hypothetical protein
MCNLEEIKNKVKSYVIRVCGLLTSSKMRRLVKTPIKRLIQLKSDTKYEITVAAVKDEQVGPFYILIHAKTELKEKKYLIKNTQEVLKTMLTDTSIQESYSGPAEFITKIKYKVVQCSHCCEEFQTHTALDCYLIIIY